MFLGVLGSPTETAVVKQVQTQFDSLHFLVKKTKEEAQKLGTSEIQWYLIRQAELDIYTVQ